MKDLCHDVFGISKEKKDPRAVKGNRELLDALPEKRTFEDGGYLSDDAKEVDSEQFEKILKCIRSGIDSGVTLETGGERFGTKGYYIAPTVFFNVQDNMSISNEEIFGPVQSFLKYKDLNDVIRRANASRVWAGCRGIYSEPQHLSTANTLMRGSFCYFCDLIVSFFYLGLI